MQFGLCGAIRSFIAIAIAAKIATQGWVYINGNIVHLPLEEKAITIEATTSSLDCQAQINYIDQDDDNNKKDNEKGIDDDLLHKKNGDHNIVLYRQDEGEGEVALQVLHTHPINSRVITIPT